MKSNKIGDNGFYKQDKINKFSEPLQNCNYSSYEEYASGY